CRETLPEAGLVYGCIKNIEDGSHIFLSLGGMTTFAKLMKKAVDITNAMKRQGKRIKEAYVLFDICTREEREKKRNFRSNFSPDKIVAFDANDLLEIPLNKTQVC
ncbi:hypothetical protein SESBI_38732, partial [Sesbania bispinosa]